MKIKQIKVNRFHTLKNIVINCQGQVAKVSEDMNSGKTSALNAIKWLFSEKKATKAVNDERDVEIEMEIDSQSCSYRATSTGGKITHYYNGKKITKAAKNKIVQFPPEIVNFCLSTEYCYSHSQVTRSIIAWLMGAKESDISKEDAIREIGEINIEEARSILTKSKQRTERIKYLEGEIINERIKAEALGVYRGYLEDVVQKFNIGSNVLAQEIMSAMNKINLCKSLVNSYNIELDKIKSDGFDVYAAKQKLIRYELLKTIINHSAEKSSTFISEPIHSMLHELGLFPNDLGIKIVRNEISMCNDIGEILDWKFSKTQEKVIEFALKNYVANCSAASLRGFGLFCLDDVKPRLAERLIERLNPETSVIMVVD